MQEGGITHTNTIEHNMCVVVVAAVCQFIKWVMHSYTYDDQCSHLSGSGHKNYITQDKSSCRGLIQGLQESGHKEKARSKILATRNHNLLIADKQLTISEWGHLRK